MKKIAICIVALLSFLALSGSSCQSPSTGGRHEPGKHAAPKEPKPAPDPNLRGSEIGNVQITVWTECSDDKAVVSWNAGFGLNNQTCKRPGAHWDDTTKPNAHVHGIIGHFNIGEKGRLYMQIVQNNNGRIVCTTSNDDDRSAGAPPCDGVIVI